MNECHFYIIDRWAALVGISYEQFEIASTLLCADAPVTDFSQIIFEACAYRCKQSEILVLMVVITMFAPLLEEVQICLLVWLGAQVNDPTSFWSIPGLYRRSLQL